MKRKFTKKGILCDLDDTLCDTEGAFKRYGRKAAYKVLKKHLSLESFRQFVELLHEAKVEIKKELAGTASSHNRILYFQRMSEKLNKRLDPEILRKAYRSYWRETYEHLELFPEVEDTFQILNENKILIAIVSDMSTEIQLEKIHYLGISEYVDLVVTSEEVGKEKPHSSIFLFALHKMNLLPKDVIMIGDAPERDIEGAEALGFDTVQFVYRKDREVGKEGYQKPDNVVRRFSEVLKYL